ncbi:MAG: 3-oxoadipate enol-lactonase, partial [Solirubrobacteraceae bacterium]
GARRRNGRASAPGGFVPVHRVVEGPQNAPALVLGNPLGTATGVWDEVAQLLNEQLRIVRYDHRGQGLSPVPEGDYDIADLGADAIALLDALGIERAVYCGMSIGGMVGLWLAAHAPERIAALVAICTSAHPGDPDGWARRAATVLDAGCTQPVIDAVTARWLTPEFAESHPQARRQLRSMLLASPAQGYAACCGALERLDLRPQLAEIECPVLVVSGAQDEALPAAHGEAITEAIEGSRHVLLDPAAHIPTAQRPHTIARLIVEHGFEVTDQGSGGRRRR